MTIGFGSRVLSLLVCTTLALSACDDDGGGGKTAEDAGEDSGGDDDMDAGEPEEDASGNEMPRDAGSDAARDSAPPMDAENPYTCEPPEPPDGSITVGEACCDGLGTCIALTGDAGTSLGYGDCKASDGLRCLPVSASGDAGAGDGGAGGLVNCRMKPAGTADGGTDYEGRCVPECLTRGASNLPQGECADTFVCVPCYSLITGASTGACNNAGDAPVEPAPPGFDECGDSAGYCVPSSNVGSTGANLPQLTCDEDERCAPKSRVVQSNSCFAHCDSVFGAGACVPAFLVPESNRSILQPASCASGELCSPCVNPLTMMATGACR
jgi:hypothetical protein